MPMRRNPRREHAGTCALALATMLLGACATGKDAARDESAERIEDIIRPAQGAEPIPEGITLGPDAPPLSGERLEEPLALGQAAIPSVDEAPLVEEGPDASAALRGLPFAWGVPAAPCQPPPHGAILPAPVPLSCLLNPGAIEYRLEPRPGGSIPGLLP